ncbi:cation transporter [Chromohalobacter canadensis]|uniref:Cation transporter n=1 Tax=Chromohalobacter moromii TaxID=2860329 RepID=A0A9X2X0B4_9GAMM|nr:MULTISPECIES: cation transporter [Chromohalobacter]MCT8467473.1 cation transporter [Chromohalobacter canadensis]MCT8470779.1 cation transporter [Chromohalobacter canadensis]MCT8497970.1 cation transporter [Chromohalobacter canadensis]MCT8504346.1 cation transporter [Chromohalobacter moromii]
MACCCGSSPSPESTPRYRRVLWIALVVNAVMFGVEMLAGVKADSTSLMADSLDFLGDAANYAISLGVLGMGLVWRARASLIKAATLAGFGVVVLGVTLHNLLAGSHPDAPTMGAVGLLALFANLAVLVLLMRYREGDSNMRSVWICTRNDVIGNGAVLLAALGVFGSGNALPDTIVGAVFAFLSLSGGWKIARQARGELRQAREAEQSGATTAAESR